ncbi:hypothetical protein ACB098_02G166100 [Castanea mollissima]|uniref:Uncharacterized protein n=1 Tax=Castanea mollissima TaxID=60419 RepID=A0A8J4VUR9_9ROSI|nr:hypothetical protein CMV_013601 [Castanea mollissima]
MAQSKLISAFLFLVFILSQQVQSIERRHLRVRKNSYESQTLQTHTKIYEAETIIHGDVLHGDEKSNEEITSESSPTPPAVSVSQLPPPNRGVDDFRPTAPGHSPGVGHSIQN